MLASNRMSVSDAISASYHYELINGDQIPDLDTPYSKFPNPDRAQAQPGDPSINDILSERQQQLDAVVHDISGLDKVVGKINDLRQQLVEKQDKVNQSLILHRGHTSALWRLPDEVLCQIFVHCLPETDHRVSTKVAPILLTRVCRRWREVVINMPSLWCRLSIEVRWASKNWEKAAFWYDLWLNRLRKRPISLAIHGYSSGGATVLHNLLEPYTSQISSLQIDSVSLLHFKLFRGLPALQEVTLRWGDYCNGTSIARFLSSLPCTLRRLRLQGSMFDPFEGLSTCQVWAHLTNVEMTANQPQDLPHLLHLCPNLSLLEIDLDFAEIFIQPLEPFAHANLRSLSMSCCTWAAPKSLPDLINALTLPDLRVFEAHHVGRGWPHEELKTFLARSNCPLECLIFGAITTAEQRAEYIALIPSLDVVLDSSRHNRG
jgi:hypothetical protein